MLKYMALFPTTEYKCYLNGSDRFKVMYVYVAWFAAH